MSANIESVAQLQRVFGSRVTWHQRTIEGFARWLGRPGTLYVLVAAVTLWVGYDGAARVLGWPLFDRPPFIWLQSALTVYGAIVSTTVLTAQNRQQLESEQRAHLDLQMSLLGEQKVTKIISLLEELRRDLPNVRDRSDLEAEAMQKRSDPRDVLSALETTMGVAGSEEEAGPPGRDPTRT